jgi:hypothetical protein
MELVVVLVIVGVVFASALVVLPLGHVSPVIKELKAFAKRIEYERDQALFSARPRGLGIWYGGFVAFAWYPERGWLTVGDSGSRGAVEFESINVTDLVAAGRQVSVGEETATNPHVIFTPNGEVTPLEARIIGLSGVDYRLYVDALGDVQYSTR